MANDVRIDAFTQLVSDHVGVTPTPEETAAWKSLLDDIRWIADIYISGGTSLVLEVKPTSGPLNGLDGRLTWAEFSGMVVHRWGETIQTVALARLAAIFVAHNSIEYLEGVE